MPYLALRFLKLGSEVLGGDSGALGPWTQDTLIQAWFCRRPLRSSRERTSQYPRLRAVERSKQPQTLEESACLLSLLLTSLSPVVAQAGLGGA